MPEASTAEERAAAKAMARLTSSLALVSGTGDEIEAMRLEARARQQALGIDRVDYHPDFCEIVRQCGAQGMFQSEWAAAIGCSETALWTWGQTYAEFQDALDEAKSLAKAFWERLGRKGVMTQGFNQALWALIMRAKWRNTVDGLPEYGDKPGETGGGGRDPYSEKSEEDLRAEVERRHAQVTARSWASKPKG